MELNADALVRVLAVCCGEEPAGPEEAVWLCRQRQPSFLATLCSAWEGLNAGLEFELESQRARVAFYRVLAASLDSPSVIPLKGLEVGRLHPDGWVRYMNDLDYHVAEPELLWEVAASLIERDWSLDSGTFTRVNNSLQVLLSFRLPHPDRYQLPYGVELTTYVSLGDLGGVPPVLALTPDLVPVKNLMMLLFERFEQPFRARDLVDGALLIESMDAGAVERMVDRLDLWPEYAELASLLSRAELGPSPRIPRDAVARARRRRAGRLVRSTLSAAGLARRTQQRMVARGLPALGRRAFERVGARWALDQGLLCFGLPVQGRAERVRVGGRDDLTWVDTPVGRFLLTPGDELPSSAETFVSGKFV